MMYEYGYDGMMWGGSLLGSLFLIFLFLDLVLVGVWLWKQINKH